LPRRALCRLRRVPLYRCESRPDGPMAGSGADRGFPAKVALISKPIRCSGCDAWFPGVGSTAAFDRMIDARLTFPLRFVGIGPLGIFTVTGNRQLRLFVLGRRAIRWKYPIRAAVRSDIGYRSASSPGMVRPAPRDPPRRVAAAALRGSRKPDALMPAARGHRIERPPVSV